MPDDGSNDFRILEADEIPGTVAKAISGLSRELVCCFDEKTLPFLAGIALMCSSTMLDLRSRGVSFRCVTEMTSANLSQCKEIMKKFDLFHASNLAGSFLIADGREYLGYFVAGDGREKMLQSANRSFVSGQKFLMNAIVDKALPARQRIVEIVKGTASEFIETIRDPIRTKSLAVDLIESAVYEIELLFSTKNSFLMAGKEAILEEMAKASERGVKVKILVMGDEPVEVSSLKTQIPNAEVQLNFMQHFLPTKITTMIVDQTRSLTIEVNDDTKVAWQDAIGLSTYANSESTVFSNASIFESLWIQAELDKQNSAKAAYFKLFKGKKLKDEIYQRRWSSVDNAGSDNF